MRFIAPEVKISLPAALPVNGRPRACPVGAVPLDPLLSQNLRETVLDVERNPAVMAAGRDITGMGGAGLGFGGCCRPELGTNNPPNGRCRLD